MRIAIPCVLKAAALAGLSMALFLLAGCDASASKRLAALEKDSAAQNARMNELAWKTASTSPSAKLTAADSGYSRIDTGVGTFFVYLKRAERYKDGYNLVVCIGNPSYMTVHGGQMHVVWGEGEGKNKQFAFAQRLEPGQWNEVEAFISPATDKDVKSMSVSLDLSNISLLGNRE